MTTVADSEAGASGRYIDFGTSSSAHNDTGAQTILAYVNPTGNQEGTFGYVFGKTPAGSADGLRLFISDNGGSPRFTFGAHSSGGTGAPNKNSPSGAIAYGSTWYVIGATWDGTINLSGIDLYVNKTKQTGATGGGGSGSIVSDASNRMFLLNRGNSGNLGRALIGNAAWIARWNRVLDQTEIDSVVDNGPLSVPSGLILCWANGQDYSSLALSPAGRSTRVAGSAPPNTALGGSGDATVTGQVLTATASLVAGSASGAGGASVNGQTLTATASLIAGAASGVVNGVLSFTLKNNTGTPLASLTGVVVNIYNPTTGALVLRATGQTTNGSGVCTVISSSLTPGTSYAFEPDLSSSSLGRRLPVQAAA